MKFQALAALTLMACGTLAACGGSEDEPQAATNGDSTGCADPSGESVHVGVAGDPDLSKLHVYKAIENMRDQGIDVEVSTFGSAPDTFRALVAGELDMWDAASIGSLIQFAEEVGEGVKYLVGVHGTTDYVLASVSEIESLDSLVGRTIGISSPGDISDTLTRYVLEQEGYDPEEFDYLQIGGTGDRIAGLLSDQIDAGALHAADAINAMRDGDLNHLHNFGDSIGSYIASGGGATTDWIADNECLVQAYVDARVDANRWAAENKQEYIEFSYDYIDESAMPEDVRAAAYDIYKDINMFPVDGGMTDEVLNGTIAVEQAAGQLDDQAPEPSTWADASYVDDYLDRNGAFEG